MRPDQSKKYISRQGHGQSTGLPPLVMKDTTVTTFQFAGEPKALQRFIDKMLNAPTNHTYEFRALLTKEGKSPIFLNFQDCARCYSHPPTGYVEEQECCFLVPLAFRKKDTQEDWAWVAWAPYAISTTSIGMNTRREIWGFHREWGEISLPSLEGPTPSWSAKTMIFRTNTAETKGNVETLISVEKESEETLPQEKTSPQNNALLFSIHGEDEEAQVSIVLEQPSVEDCLWEIPTVNLKQFRDAADGTKASYQALVYTEATILGDLPSRREGHFRLTLTTCESHRIAKDLGLPQEGPIQAVAAYDSQADISMGRGKVLWRGPRKEKIAILGGGIAALSTAFYLTQEERERYDITVYQMGWRLGGKLASGRNKEKCYRSEEHGLHVWFGFYENAFKLLRDCYEAWEPNLNVPFKKWDDAFSPLKETLVGDSKEEPPYWRITMPQIPDNMKLPHQQGEPGDGSFAMTPWESIAGAFWMINASIYAILSHAQEQEDREDLFDFLHRKVSPDASVSSLFQKATRRITELEFNKSLDLFQSIAWFKEASPTDTTEDLTSHLKEEMTSLFHLLTSAWREPDGVASLHETLGGWLFSSFLWTHSLDNDHRQHDPKHYKGLSTLLTHFKDLFYREFKDIIGETGNKWMRRLWCVIDFGAAFVRGLFNPKYGIWPEGNLNAIDHLEFGDWLCDNGLSRESLDAPILNAYYNMGFMFLGGDNNKPNIAAGHAVQVLLRMLNFRQSVLFVPNFGIGECLITPLYEVLRERGVKFQFFHKVKYLSLSQNKKSVAKIQLEVQARIKDEGGISVEKKQPQYQPIFPLHFPQKNGEVQSFHCWPTEPLWDQIENADQLKAKMQQNHTSFESHWFQYPEDIKPDTCTLEQGRDFDTVVLGISLGAFKKFNHEPTMCDDLFQANKAFRQCAENLEIVPTLAVQTWVNVPLEDLNPDLKDTTPAMSGGALWMNIWADMTPVTQWEKFPSESHAEAVHYFCSNLHTNLHKAPSYDTEVPKLAYEKVVQLARDWFENPSTVWPKKRRENDNGETTWDWLTTCDPKEAPLVGEERLRWQLLRANISPTDCCVSGFSNTFQYRLNTDESGFNNLYLTGAWIRTGFNGSSVEGAVMSGKQCARAISGQPLTIYCENFMQESNETRAGCLTVQPFSIRQWLKKKGFPI